MKKTDKKNEPKSFKDIEELGRKYGVEVANMAEDSVRAIGFLGGVRWQAASTSPRGKRLLRNVDRSLD